MDQKRADVIAAEEGPFIARAMAGAKAGGMSRERAELQGRHDFIEDRLQALRRAGKSEGQAMAELNRRHPAACQAWRHHRKLTAATGFYEDLGELSPAQQATARRIAADTEALGFDRASAFCRARHDLYAGMLSEQQRQGRTRGQALRTLARKYPATHRAWTKWQDVIRRVDERLAAQARSESRRGTPFPTAGDNTAGGNGPRPAA